MYIVFEGIDTCGKSTQLELLKPIFPEAIFTKEPGGSQIGNTIRTILLNKTQALDPLAEFFLFLADRAELISKLIIPNKEQHLIFSDRSLLSGIAYANQNLFPKNLDPTSLNLLATKHILPDKVILFQTNQALLQSRLNLKSHDSIESRGIPYLLEIQERLFNITQTLCKDKDILLLNAQEDVQTLHQKILSFL